jgi:hypothetical protein
VSKHSRTYVGPIQDDGGVDTFCHDVEEVSQLSIGKKATVPYDHLPDDQLTPSHWGACGGRATHKKEKGA